MVSDDGTKVALREPDGDFLFLRGRATSFDAQAWDMFPWARGEILTLASLDDDDANVPDWR